LHEVPSIKFKEHKASIYIHFMLENKALEYQYNRSEQLKTPSFDQNRTPQSQCEKDINICQKTSRTTADLHFLESSPKEWIWMKPMAIHGRGYIATLPWCHSIDQSSCITPPQHSLYPLEHSYDLLVKALLVVNNSPSPYKTQLVIPVATNLEIKVISYDHAKLDLNTSNAKRTETTETSQCILRRVSNTDLNLAK
jgi:hypothetical protein